MSRSHLTLVEEAKAAIGKVNGDTSVPQATTLDSLDDLKVLICEYTQAIRDTMHNEEEEE